MIKDISLHGAMGPVGFSVHVRGADAKSAYFFEETSSHIRFFSRGNEFTISGDGIHYKGTGGSFCEYMFGVEKPLEDFMNREVLNRLIMFGAYMDKSDKLLFTNNIEGGEPFDRLFLQGHAVQNYYFLVSSSYEGEPKKRQKLILSRVGKLLKRTDLLAEGIGGLLDAFWEKVGESGATVFIFRLSHKGNAEFLKAFARFYQKDRTLTSDEEELLAELVARNGTDYYQQERVKIDVMYKHPDNKYIVDEYRDILLSGVPKEGFDHSELARLRRLKTLRIRNSIPSVLFETLDELLLKGKKIQEIEEPDYLREARSILEGLFFLNPTLKSGHLIEEDIVRLVRAKSMAYAEGNMGFEKILLDVGKACDEAARETSDYSLLEGFSSIVTYFDRYDHVQASMSKVAFTENIEFTEDFLRSLLGNKKEFDVLGRGLFEELFVTNLLGNKYITRYGRKKIKAILEGVSSVAEGDASLKDVVSRLREIVEEERLYRHVHAALKEKLRTFYPRIDTKEGRDEIREDITKELEAKGFATRVPEELFEKIMLDMKKESFYINHLLPSIIKTTDKELREDFLTNSGLDRFYIESIEREYFEERGLDTFLLNLIREDRELLGVEEDMF